ncbi:MAG: LamG domain-containing protein [Tannerellaceae bacterium]|nr:LamG domain-containing protein [Tannerellaceae bacterium]
MRRRNLYKQQKAVDPKYLCYEIFDAPHDITKTGTKIAWTLGNAGVYNTFGKFTNGSLTINNPEAFFPACDLYLPDEFQVSPWVYLTPDHFPDGLSFFSFFSFNTVSSSSLGIAYRIGGGGLGSAITIILFPNGNSSMRLWVVSEGGSSTNPIADTYIDTTVTVNNHVNNWHHVACTWKSNSLYVWINGIRIFVKPANEMTTSGYLRVVKVSLSKVASIYDVMVYKGDYFGIGSTIQVPTEVFNIYI